MTALLYVLLFTALIAAAAAAAEWGVQGRMPARHFWTVAIVLALGAPPAVLAVHARQASAETTSGVAGAGSSDITVYVVNGARQTARATGNVGRLRALGRRVRSLERLAMSAATSRVTPQVMRRIRATALVLWATASLALLGWIVAGILHWRRERRAWEPATVDGIAVEVSPSTGPAVLGLLTQRIVLPSWATAMEPRYRTLMLAHECEHIRARDPQRLALALGALVLMPWNAALWWCAARLRRAIELDCDARVLRAHPAPKAYGYLLLEVASRGRNTGALAMPLVGLLRLPSELETRLRAMTRPRSIVRRTLVCASILAVGALAAAFMAPVPRAMAFGPAAVAANGSPDARTISARTIVHVGSARLTLNRATYSPAARTLTGTMTILAFDTVPAHTQDSIAILLKKLDSVRTALLRLEEHRVVLRRDVTELDSARAEALPGARYRIMIDKVDSAGRAASAEDRALREMEAAHARESVARIDSAMAKAYPDLVAHPDPKAIVWFVSDSSGHVLHTKRSVDGYSDRPLPTMQMSKMFPDVSTDQIGSVEIRKGASAHGAGAVIWITLKR